MANISLEEDMLNLASEFSDWRIYPNDLDRCTALPAPNNTDGFEKERNWKFYCEFTEHLKKFTQLFRDSCISKNEGRGFEVFFICH